MMKVSPRWILSTFAFVYIFIVIFSFITSFKQTQSISNEILSGFTAGDNPTRRAKRNNVDNDESFSACLLIMDENHRLSEWIAYHYFAMPLRFLVVAVDPHSKTSPTHIFDRWREQTDLTIVEWTDADFTNRNLIVNATEDSHKRKLRKYLTRQTLFYNKCAQFLKDKHERTWVSFHDVDEFMVINGDNVPNSPQLFRQPGSILRMVHKYRKNNADTFSPETAFWYSHFNQSPCITIARARFGAVESTDAEISEGVPDFLDPKQFNTLRYRYRADKRWKSDGRAKAIIDVSQVHIDYITTGKTHTPHRPLDFCPDAQYGYNQLPLGIHHMLGSWESFSFRDDVRKGGIRSLEFWQKRAVLNEGGLDDDARPWIGGFIELVGTKAAKHLLQDVGLPPDYEKSANDTASWQKNSFQQNK